VTDADLWYSTIFVGYEILTPVSDADKFTEALKKRTASMSNPRKQQARSNRDYISGL
jgi:hypothetical protein